ncbi:hypothetical protein E4T50_01280 [Aureobasidium sp. EXF-12298]|nr:hypothetical protein E4T50_01280 [Aureobasidium sp. EXF-12298]
MPLVIPRMQSSGGDDKTSKWMDQLMGKKLGDSSDNMTFAKKDLPQQHRVVKGDSMMTMDHNPDRLGYKEKMQEDKNKTDRDIVSTSTLAMTVPYTRSPTVKPSLSLLDDQRTQS